MGRSRAVWSDRADGLESWRLVPDAARAEGFSEMLSAMLEGHLLFGSTSVPRCLNVFIAAARSVCMRVFLFKWILRCQVGDVDGTCPSKNLKRCPQCNDPTLKRTHS